jgi:PPM family protein phosphatase
MRIRPGIELGNLTDIGCQRDNNEDYFCYWEPEGDQEFAVKGRLAIVADGMGGNEGGEVASRLAVDAVRQRYSGYTTDPQSGLLAGFRTAHETIRQCVRNHPELVGMGTTCTAVAVTDCYLYFAHVGDSRLYLLRDSSLWRLTKDHSYVDRMIDSGMISADEAREHPQRHVLTAALGAKGEVRAEFPEQPLPLQPGDLIFLCTDGLSGMLSDGELPAILTGHAPPEACRKLVDTAKARGGPDNITVQILKMVSTIESASATRVLVNNAEEWRA